MSSYESVRAVTVLERFLYERSPLDKVALTRAELGVQAATALATPLMEITAHSRHLCDSVSNPPALLLSPKTRSGLFRLFLVEASQLFFLAP